MNGAPAKLREDTAGFTLLELLVAIVLMALLTTILLAAFRFEARQLDRQATRLSQSAEVPVAYSFLKAHLADARPLLPVNSRGTSIAFDGSSTGISFLGTAPESAPQGGLYLFTINVVAAHLRASWQRFEGLLPAADEGAGEAVLLDRVRRARVSYFGSSEPGANPQWHGEWRDLPYLPALVRLELDFVDGEQPPALVVAPRLAPLQGARPAVTGVLR
jgi:general secretion pathway protein J